MVNTSSREIKAFMLKMLFTPGIFRRVSVRVAPGRTPPASDLLHRPYRYNRSQQATKAIAD